MDKYNMSGTSSHAVKRYDYTAESSVLVGTTSIGELPKFTHVRDGQLFYIKAGSKHANKYSNLEPVVEAICCRIGKLIGINVVQYELEWMPGSPFGVKDDVLVCVSEDFKNPTTGIYLTGEEFCGPRINEDNLYAAFTEPFTFLQDDIDKMILFDYIINNADRHLNNFYIQFPFIDSAGLAPLFDNERGLLSECNLEDVDEFEDLLLYEEAKPFDYKHSDAIQRVKNINRLGLDFSREAVEFFPVFEMYKDLVSRDRMTLMKSIFTRRYNYVRNLSINV
ncbi:HipA domain-containing protein [Cohnella fermenti]|uniref:HipA-like C-terminal domain-containing protein n=1 Tax=Cohnella fermenti TaxID=2565925 RepID=A0A4S4BGU0_9BACL|nr:hypothetical protein [Cohnella fermenti]THF73683.1 hypothetical protein E6C55_28275 [Cohnella fermenti]